MEFKVITIMTTALGGQNLAITLEDVLNRLGEDGFEYLFHFSSDSTRLTIVMGKAKERRGRPPKRAAAQTEEVTEMED